MDVNQQSNDLSDHEFLLAKLELTVCLIQYKFLSALIEMHSRQYFPWKMKQCKNYLIFMAPCCIFKWVKYTLTSTKENRNVNIIIMKIMIVIILMMIIIMIIIVIIIAIMIMMIKIILIIAAVIKIKNSPFQPGEFSTRSTTDIYILIQKWKNKSVNGIYIFHEKELKVLEKELDFAPILLRLNVSTISKFYLINALRLLFCDDTFFK